MTDFDSLPQLPTPLGVVTIGDIPSKYMKPRSTLPFQAIHVDANAGIFMSSLKVCKNTKPSELKMLEKNLEEIFVPKTFGEINNEKAFVSLSVRSTLDLYL